MKKTAQLIGYAMLLYLGVMFAVEFAIIIIAQIIMMVPVIINGGNIENVQAFAQDGWFLTISSIVCSYAAAPVSAWLLLRKKPYGSFTKSSLSIGKILMCGCVSMATLYFFGYLSQAILWIVAKLFHTTAEQLNAVNQMGSQLSIFQYVLMVCIFAPIVEELFFRRFIIRKMIVHGELAALVVSAFVFGMVHGTLSQIPYALAVGLVFGYIYIRFGNIYLNIGLHLFLNFMGGVFDLLIADVPYAEYISPAISIAFIAAAVVVLIVKRKDIRVNTVDNAEGLTAARQIKTVLLNPGMILYTVFCLLVMIVSLASTILLQYIS